MKKRVKKSKNNFFRKTVKNKLTTASHLTAEALKFKQFLSVSAIVAVHRFEINTFRCLTFKDSIKTISLSLKSIKIGKCSSCNF